MRWVRMGINSLILETKDLTRSISGIGVTILWKVSLFTDKNLANREKGKVNTLPVDRTWNHAIILRWKNGIILGYPDWVIDIGTANLIWGAPPYTVQSEVTMNLSPREDRVTFRWGWVGFPGRVTDSAFAGSGLPYRDSRDLKESKRRKPPIHSKWESSEFWILSGCER